MLEEYHQEKYWREYVADHLWHTANAIYSAVGADFRSPFYSEVIHPQPKENPEEVKAKVIRLFSE